MDPIIKKTRWATDLKLFVGCPCRAPLTKKITLRICIWGPKVSKITALGLTNYPFQLSTDLSAFAKKGAAAGAKP